MALVSLDAQNASLANDYGPTKGPNAPASLQVALFDGDPLTGGVELAPDGGYVRVTVPNDGSTWPTAPDGGAVTSVALSWGPSTDAWSAVATHFVLFDDADGATAWDSGLLADGGVSVDSAGVTSAAACTVYYNQAGA